MRRFAVSFLVLGGFATLLTLITDMVPAGAKPGQLVVRGLLAFPSSLTSAGGEVTLAAEAYNFPPPCSRQTRQSVDCQRQVQCAMAAAT